MRVLILSVLFFTAFTLVSCDKEEDKEYKCTFGETVVLEDGQHKIAKWDVDPAVEKYVLVDLVKDTDCNYYIDGKVKYVLRNKVVAFVDYGYGTAGNWALMTTYVLDKDDFGDRLARYEPNSGAGCSRGGDWDKKDWDKEMECFKFEQVCKQATSITTSVADHTASPVTNTARSN